MSDPIVAPESGTPATQPAAATPPSPLETKLDGDGIPEEFRGKSVKDVLSSLNDIKAAKTRAEQEAAQWRALTASKMEPPKTEEEDPLSAVDPKILEGLQRRFNGQIEPMHMAVGSILKMAARAEFEDFAEYEKEATQIYNSLPAVHRYSDEYGWRFAYNMAKSTRASHAPKKSATHPNMAPSMQPPAPAKTELTDLQKKIAKEMDITEEEYIKFMNEQD
jgi:hypothetical protein